MMAGIVKRLQPLADAKSVVLETDYVKEKEELIKSYSNQLELYKRALEEALNKKVDKVYIYSTCLSKEIIVL
mgnify:CR=1 FL=1